MDLSTLSSKLATSLPKATGLKIYHLSTPPTRTSALYAAPHGSRPERTYRESHFLAVSIPIPGNSDAYKEGEILVYAVEVFIYSTAQDTTFFVSKADSTGYLNLLMLDVGTPSPIRTVTSVFLSHLLDTHQRPHIRNVISLFARAQDQYLFPGSIEYSGKHVLDDRGLVRWWCRVLDPIIEHARRPDSPSQLWDSVDGYLIIPGLDPHETLSYVPRTTSARSSWTVGHPLLEISHYRGNVAPRCVIPHFPDDPKARFVDELDEEMTKGKSFNGHWKSVQSIDQFWEMMAFRQECSAGNLVGFIWIVFAPPIQAESAEHTVSVAQYPPASGRSRVLGEVSRRPHMVRRSSQDIPPNPSVHHSSQVDVTNSHFSSDLDRDSKASQYARGSSNFHTRRKRKRLTGLIIPREPRVKTETGRCDTKIPERTPYYVWTPLARGQLIVDDLVYKRATELLLRLDFADLNLAVSSSERWVQEVRSGVRVDCRDAWGTVITGTSAAHAHVYECVPSANTLDNGLIQKKPKESSIAIAPQINILSTNTLRKKAKV